MSRVAVNPIEPGDARSAASLNAFYTAFEAADPLSADNFAPEGLPGPSFVAHQKCEVVGKVSELTRVGATLGNTAFVQYAPNGTAFRVSTIDLLANEVLRIKGRVELRATKAAGVGLGAGADFGLRIAYRVGGVTSTPSRFMRHESRSGVMPVNINLHGTVGVLGYLVGPLTIEWVELQYSLTVGPAFPIASVLLIDRFRRVS